MDNIPTPKTDALRHIQNFGEAGTFFSVSLGLSLAAVYFRQLEIVLALAYCVTIIYTTLTFQNNAKETFFRFIAITLGVSVGIRELLIYFWVPVLAAILVVIAVGILGFMAFRHFQLMLSQPQPGGKNE